MIELLIFTASAGILFILSVLVRWFIIAQALKANVLADSIPKIEQTKPAQPETQIRRYTAPECIRMLTTAYLAGVSGCTGRNISELAELEQYGFKAYEVACRLLSVNPQVEQKIKENFNQKLN